MNYSITKVSMKQILKINVFGKELFHVVMLTWKRKDYLRG